MPAHRKDPPRKDAPPADEPQPQGLKRAGAFLDRWPFRRKVNVLVVVPVLVVAGLLGYGVNNQISSARTAGDTARLTRDSVQVARLIDDVQAEHRQAVLVSLHYEAAGTTDSGAVLPSNERPDTTAFTAAQRAVTKQVQAVRDAFGDRLPPGENDAIREIGSLDTLRDGVADGPMPADNLDPAYSRIVDALIDGLDLENQPGGAAGGSVPAQLDALLRADIAHASFETSVFAASTGDPNALNEFTIAVGQFEQYTLQAARFTKYATPSQSYELSRIEHGADAGNVQRFYASLSIDPGNQVSEGPAQVRAGLEESLRDAPTYERQAASRLKIAQSLIGQIADSTEDASHTAWWQAGQLVGVALLAFAVWLLFSVLARRSVLRAVRRLTGAARGVADATGKELARITDDEAQDTGPPRLPAVPIPVHDEIGELAEAFNQVQETATALLERQVLSRRNIAEMFGNVGRRVSNLTARQLALIDAVERGETDAAVLERLYRIDHIAVRLQRNADSLMLLAGIREAGLDASPSRLSTTVRAALGRIEGYQRVVPSADGDVTLAPDMVGDLTLMLAELLENAVTFSPASSRVEVRLLAVPGGRGAVIEIVDHGLGMNPERLNEENARLVRRERLDLVPTKVLGLFVVGVLSRRWGITVTLTRTPGGGVTAAVEIPSDHLLPMGPATEPITAPSRPAVAAAPAPPPLAPPAPAYHGGHESGPQRPQQPQWGQDDEPRAPEAPAGPRVPQWAQQNAAAAHQGPGGGYQGTDPGGHQGTAAPQGPGGHQGFGGHQGPGGHQGAGPEPERYRGHGERPPALPRRTPAAEQHSRPPYAQERPRGGPGTRPAGAPQQGGGAPQRPASDGRDAPRPLKRRVRGATLAATNASSMLSPEPRHQRPSVWRPADAEATRSEIDDFEAAVERARRDSVGAEPRWAVRDQAGHPGGTGQAATPPPSLPRRQPPPDHPSQANRPSQATNPQRNGPNMRPFPPSSSSSDSSSEGVNQ
ncbi:ATP-binding protein [Streptomyces sp. NPDC050560]|uniref:ATP-binding protein n=1 Tax=Streptomyces sp. NPDC050560 TaxID=3365630 RepID=UPI0037AA20FB